MDHFLIVFIFLILYILLLSVVKHFKIAAKKSCNNCNNCCPDCKSALNRIKRLATDKILHHLTFRLFDPRRYICNECGWEGLKWEEKFQPGKD